MLPHTCASITLCLPSVEIHPSPQARMPVPPRRTRSGLRVLSMRLNNFAQDIPDWMLFQVTGETGRGAAAVCAVVVGAAGVGGGGAECCGGARETGCAVHHARPTGTSLPIAPSPHAPSRPAPQLPDIVSLDLSFNSLTGSIVTFSVMPHLESVNLMYNSLAGALPKGSDGPFLSTLLLVRVAAVATANAQYGTLDETRR